MEKVKNWRDTIIPCECPKWGTCKYGTYLDWKSRRYAVCGYSFMEDDDTNGRTVSNCDKYTPKES